MIKQVLVTDSLFVAEEHEALLHAAGLRVCRLDKSDASEGDLITEIQGKAGYILGGVERVTNAVIDAAEALEAIVFCGIGKGFIPAWDYAVDKGIKIADVPDGNTQAVAEWSIAAALSMTRGMFDLGRVGAGTSMTTAGLERSTVGIIGLGRIGRRIAEMVAGFRPARTVYNSRTRHEDVEERLGIEYDQFSSVLRDSDVLFLCVSDEVGRGYFTSLQFDQMKQNSLLVTFMHPGVVDADALYDAVRSGRIRAVSDYPMDARFADFPLSSWYCFNASNAFNTTHSIKHTSDIAVKTLIRLINPE